MIESCVVTGPHCRGSVKTKLPSFVGIRLLVIGCIARNCSVNAFRRETLIVRWSRTSRFVLPSLMDSLNGEFEQQWPQHKSVWGNGNSP